MWSTGTLALAAAAAVLAGVVAGGTAQAGSGTGHDDFPPAAGLGPTPAAGRARHRHQVPQAHAEAHPEAQPPPRHCRRRDRC